MKDIHKKLVLLMTKLFPKTFHILADISNDVAVLRKSSVTESVKMSL